MPVVGLPADLSVELPRLKAADAEIGSTETWRCHLPPYGVPPATIEV